MTKQKHKKRLVRARMEKTGESHQTAQRVISEAAVGPTTDRAPPIPALQEDISSSAEAKVGAILAGRYRIRRIVPFAPGTLAGAGRGETQTVTYDAEHALLGGVCSIKLLRRGAEPHLRGWLLREGRALQRASHPQVLKVFDIGETDDAEVYLVLERAPEATLDVHLDKARLDERGALSIVRQLARILEHMHEKGVVHRGLRSGAVHVEERGDDVSVKLASFGYASLAGDPRLVARGSVFGHAAWMSPEQARGDEVDERTDLYALGVLLYAMLAYRLPFASEDRDALLVMQREAPVPPLRGPGEAPSALDAICMKLLAKNRDERYASATALLAALPP